MLLISSTFTQLVSVCLALYTSAAFASPAALDFTQGWLERRKPKDGVFCNPPSSWLLRECLPLTNTWAWREVCIDDVSGRTYFNNKCQSNEMCQNIIDASNDYSIRCVPILQPKEVWPRTSQEDPILGCSDTKAAADTNDITWFGWNVQILDDLGPCSVAAVALSNDQTWVLETPRVIVGRVRHTGVAACQGDKRDWSNPSKARECYPRSVVYLKKGDYIDFTWGMVHVEEATLQYAIVPVGGI